MAAAGSARARASQVSARADRQETRTKAGRLLLMRSVAAMTAQVRTWRARVARSKQAVIPRHTVDVVLSIRPGTLALIASRVIVDGVALDRSYASIASEIGRAVEDEARLLVVKKERGPAWRQLKRTALRDSRRSARVLRSRKWLKLLEGVSLPAFGQRERNLVGATLLELFRMSTGVIQFVPGKPTRRRAGPTMVAAVPEVLEWLVKSHEAHLTVSPVYLPTLDRPLPWSTVDGGGYLTDAVTRRTLVSTRDAHHLRHLREVDMPSVYAAVNLLQSTPWRVNRRVFDAARAVLDAGRGESVGLPAMDDRAVPRMPPDAVKGTDEFRAAKLERAVVFDFNAAQRSRRLLVSRTLGMAAQFSAADRFHYPHHLDFRGRLYPTPGFLNPQGADLAAGLLEFADDAGVLTDGGRRWWLIHGANTRGHDKLRLDARVAWADSVDTRRMCQDIAANPVGTSHIWGASSKPFQFLAWAFECAALHSGHGEMLSRAPCMVDGSNNGLQIYSLLLGDAAGARATNCLPCDAPEDMYRIVADIVTARLKADAVGGTVLPGLWLALLGPAGLPRDATKRSTMTNPYGSTLFACQRYVGSWYEETYGSTHSFGKLRWQATIYLAGLIWDAIEACVPSAIRGRKWFRAVADVCSANDVAASWIAPTGFPVIQRYPKILSTQSDIKTLVGDTTRRMTVRMGVEDWSAMDRTRQRNALAPNVIHSYDAAAMSETLSDMAARGVTACRAVHDGGGPHANHVPLFLDGMKEAYVTIFSLDLLGRFDQDIRATLPAGVKLPPIPIRGDFDVRRVLESDYLFS